MLLITQECPESKPTQHTTRHQEFNGREFYVMREVLIFPSETEHLTETVLLPLSVDQILCNPPYGPSGDEITLQKETHDHKSPLVLYGDTSGVEPYPVVIKQMVRALCPSG